MGPLDHGLLGGADPDPRVVELLVRLVRAVRVADLREVDEETEWKEETKGEFVLPAPEGSPRSSCRSP